MNDDWAELFSGDQVGGCQYNEEGDEEGDEEEEEEEEEEGKTQQSWESRATRGSFQKGFELEVGW